MRSPTKRNVVGGPKPERMMWWWTLSKLDKIQMKSKHKRSLVCAVWCVRHWRAGSIWCRWLFHYDYYLFHCFKCANNNPTSICACNSYVLPNASDLVAAIHLRNTEWICHGILKRKNWEQDRQSLCDSLFSSLFVLDFVRMWVVSLCWNQMSTNMLKND